MRIMKKSFLTLCFAIIHFIGNSNALPTFKIIAQEANNIKIEVNQKLELFHIMAWLGKANHLNNFDFKYKVEINNYFEPFRDHIAVQFVRKVLANYHSHLAINGLFIRNDFLNDSTFIKFLNVKDFGLDDTYSNRIAIMDSLSKVVTSFADITNFEKFANQHEKYYYQKITEVKEALSGLDLKKCFESFWGLQKDNYHIVICMLEQDIHAYWYKDKKGSNIIFYLSPKFLVENDAKFGNATESNLQEGKMSAVDYLYYGAGHEMGHGFINPVVDNYYQDVEKIKFQIQTGDSKTNFLCESILRSLTAFFLIENNRNNDALMVLQMEKQQGYIYNELILELIRDYSRNRAKFTSFNTYMPTLLTQLNKKVK